MNPMNPSNADMAGDLAYVRSAIERQRFTRDELAIALVWAGVNLIGLSLFDWTTWGGGLFWMAALPLFGIGCWVWAARRAQAQGEMDEALGKRHALHWTAIPVFILISNFIYVGNPDLLLAGKVVLLIIALVYYLAGVHFWRGYLYGGVALASGVIWLTLLDQWAWTLTGVLTFTALTVPAVRAFQRGAEN